MTRASTGAGAIAGLVLVIALACGGEERSVAGRWMGEDPDGNRMTFHFDEGGEARWIVRSRSAARAGTIAMRYEVDTTASPHHIDLSGFEEGPLEGALMVGIYELVGDDSLRIDLEPVIGAVDPDSTRPKSFRDPVVILTRVEEPE